MRQFTTPLTDKRSFACPECKTTVDVVGSVVTRRCSCGTVLNVETLSQKSGDRYKYRYRVTVREWL